MPYLLRVLIVCFLVSPLAPRLDATARGLDATARGLDATATELDATAREEVSDAEVQEQVARVRGYTIAFMNAGPGSSETPEAELAQLRQAHLRHLFTLKRRGRVVLAGPVREHATIQGIVILATGDVDEARKLLSTDPLVERGLLQLEVHPFYGIPGDTLP